MAAVALPILLKTGTVSGTSTAGQGASDLVIGETVTITDTEVANAGSTRLTVFEDVPIDSALTQLTNDTSDSPSFIPDVTGSYRVKMTVDGVWIASEVYAVPLTNTGARIPSFKEQLQYDGGSNTLGWHEAMTKFMRAVDGFVVPITINAGGVVSHTSDTPLVVSMFQFDPTSYGLPDTTRVLKFRAVGSNGGNVPLTKAQLYSISDAEYIGSGLSFTQATPSLLEESLVLGSGAGEIDLAAKIYECRIWVVSPDHVDDTIEFGSADLRIEKV